MSIIMVLTLAFLIVSVVMAALYGGWTNPLLWVAWAFAVRFLLADVLA